MSFFDKFGKKAAAADSDDNTSPEAKSAAPAKKLHTKRRKKSLIAQMKVRESVPATVIDAVNGDQSVVNSDNDFVRAQKLQFKQGVRYPVFVLDEDSLEAAGLGDKENKDTLGALSVGLKTSSGATGLLPVATTESLDSDYITLLPMHDAFQVLRDYSVFSNYKPGWRVALLSIDNDELSLKLTSMRLSMAQWWAYLNSDLNFKVEDDKLVTDQDLPTVSDPLAINSEESRGGVPIDPSTLAATHEFDDDDGTASSSVIDSFVNSDTPASGATSTDYAAGAATATAPVNGYSIDEFDEPEGDDEGVPVDDDEDVDTADATPSAAILDDAQPTSTGYDNVQPVTPEPQPTQQPVAAPVSQPAPVAAPTPAQKPNPYVESVTRDDLEAENLTMQASVRTLNDLKVSISDRDFVETYLNNLTIDELPLLDASNDPTGRIAHMNSLREQANVTLRANLKSRKAHLQQWFESQRTGVLEALHDGTRDDASEINGKRSNMKDLQAQLNDDSTLQIQAQASAKAELNEMDAEFERQLENAKQAALVEVETQFNEKRAILKQQKDDLLQQTVAKQRQAIAVQITSIKDKVQEIAQTAASKAYTDVMNQASLVYRQQQQGLSKLHDKLMTQLDDVERRSRADENKRVADQADIARHDTTIATLREQIQQIEARHKSALDESKLQFEAQLEAVQSQATTAQQNAVARVEDDLEKTKADRDRIKEQADNQQEKNDDRADKVNKEHRKEIKALRAEMRDFEDKQDRVLRRTRWGWAFVAFALLLLGLGAGALGGGLFTALNVNKQQAQQVQQVAPATTTTTNRSSTSNNNDGSDSSSQGSSGQNQSNNNSSTNSSKSDSSTSSTASSSSNK